MSRTFRFDRRRFLQISAAGALAGFGGRLGGAAEATLEPRVENGIAWYNVQNWGIEGKGWTDTARYFDRLPATAEGKVPAAVWSLSRHSAGISVRFATDASAIHARYSLLSASLAMPHMPATGVSGLDLYARDDSGRDRWLAVARPTAQQMTLELAGSIDPLSGGKPRLYTVYLPLYNGVESLEIGVAPQAAFQPLAPRTDPPLVFYGTSIMHGACASRPGMSITGILGRRFDRPTINLGFSGNGRMDPEVVELLAELTPCVYAIDCLPNMVEQQVAERTEPLVRRLRESRPDTPILLVEDRTYTNAAFRQSSRDRHSGARAELRKAYERLTAGGIKHLYYLEGDVLLGDDGEAATDGSHPSDLGMVRYADAYEQRLRAILAL